jgi:hypothetical protein
MDWYRILSRTKLRSVISHNTVILSSVGTVDRHLNCDTLLLEGRCTRSYEPPRPREYRGG